MGKSKFALYQDLGEVGDTVVTFTIWYNHTQTNWETGVFTELGYRICMAWQDFYGNRMSIDESLFVIDRQSITRLRLAIKKFKARKHLYLEDVGKVIAQQPNPISGE